MSHTKKKIKDDLRNSPITETLSEDFDKSMRGTRIQSVCEACLKINRRSWVIFAAAKRPFVFRDLDAVRPVRI
ncbi:hypothetical protein PUN28_013045 [Cardiocondyla obscurior]|uniref:Uncharacterized protein n=1 Tax=Cardiocondyla obscurior TaxID=286306 RepID=A0AAW2F6Q2_9HYME